MAVSLQKGQKVSLTKSNPGLSKVMVGLGWDEAPQKSQGVFGALFGGGKTQDIDCARLRSFFRGESSAPRRISSTSEISAI